MAAPNYQAVGTQATSTGASTNVSWPSHLTNDIGVLVIETAGNSASIGAPSGWTAIESSVTDVATLAGSRLHVFWKRAASGAEASVASGTGTDHILARIFTFRGTVASGSPINVSTVSSKATASTTATIPSLTTTVDEALIVMVVGRPSDDASTTHFGVPVNANLTGLGEAIESGIITGHGGGIVVSYGVKATAGATGTSTMTKAVSTTDTYITFALAPAVPIIAQSAFRFYEDGTESGSTAIAAQNTNVSRAVDSDSNLALRVRLQDSAGVTGNSTDDYQLQYSLNSGNYANIGSAPAGTATYYFDGSQGINDPNNVWANDANGFDGNTATEATTSDANTGTSSTNYLEGIGTNAPTSGGIVTGVRMRCWRPITTTAETKNEIFYSGVSLGSVTVSSFGAYSSYVTLATPSGGWTWQKIHDLYVRSYCVGIVDIFNARVARTEIEVTYSGTSVAVNGYNSGSLTEGDATTNRLGAGTGVFNPGKIAEDGLVDNVTLGASGYMENLYSLTLVSSALANSDTIDFRVLRNGAVIGSYAVTPRITASKTGGGGGSVNNQRLTMMGIG